MKFLFEKKIKFFKKKKDDLRKMEIFDEKKIICKKKCNFRKQNLQNINFMFNLNCIQDCYILRFFEIFEKLRLKTLLNPEIPPDCYTFFCNSNFCESSYFSNFFVILFFGNNFTNPHHCLPRHHN